jgi:spore germination cell wall hydrolase CwlJ-like protein
MRDSNGLSRRPYVRASYALACLVVLAVLVLVVAGRFGALAEGSYSVATTRLGDARAPASAAEPTPPVALIVKQVDPTDALRINSEIPINSGPNPAASPFSMAKASPAAREHALDCLTAAVYYEAARESPDGQRAVAQVVLNRVRHPAFPASVCSVVFQGSTLPTGCQFTFTCDGSMLRPPERSYWQRARAIAAAALGGAVFQPVGMATHYHANYVVPVWAPDLTKNAVIGAHIFYRWKGNWGTPAAFTEHYSAVEPDMDSLKQTALAALAARQVLAATMDDGAPAADGSGDVPAAQQLAAVDAKLTIARQSLGAKNPQLIELQKQREAVAKQVQSPAAELAAVEAQIKDASRTLGPNHPQMKALEQRRAELVSGRKS